ncbi:scamp-domain-containing protein [Tilletiaria anomala UBC 951]|uniref:Scamp-domain-containing protein n=1 Tax=Tilletiaria anomala (strain ATCC 24038 / CBS 436.72 / UBC 951) TaxID=1037660 RepID=A0A066WPM4_TILAU|nr:scamp-domain-containing protein [Tilletiaria anomala UBC 951]KDN52575.1 scamp-domain-containing protein [Tilletiaria anomala UBC 951]
MADPFADRNALDANPFADPSVQGALSSGNRAYEDVGSSKSMAFEEDGYGHSGSGVDLGSGGAGQSDAARLAEIERRERELEQRERDLQSRADHIKKHGRNNWPFFYPLIYHDIDVEIPPESQQVVRHLYLLWMLWSASLCINMLACIFLLVSGARDGARDMISSIVYFPILTTLAFLLWYRPAYNAFNTENSLWYYVYFLFMGFHLAYSAYSLIGIPSTGCAGIITVISSFSSSRILAGIFATINTIMVAVQGLGNLWYFREIWKHNHEQGHTFAQAKQELATHGMKAYLTRGSQV